MKGTVLLVVLLAIGGVSAQEAKVIQLSELRTLLSEENSQLKVINFWASWCGPCIKELPYFDEAGLAGLADVHLVSVDFVQDKEKADRVLRKQAIQSRAYLLKATDYDSFIPIVDQSWSGAIPATLFITASGQKHFYERAFTKKELNELIIALKTK